MTNHVFQLHRIPLGYHVGWWPSVYLLGVKRFFFFGFHSSWYSCQFFSLSTLVLCLLSLPICLCAFVWLPHLSNAGSSWSPPSGLAHLWQSTDLPLIWISKGSLCFPQRGFVSVSWREKSVSLSSLKTAWTVGLDTVHRDCRCFCLFWKTVNKLTELHSESEYDTL